MFETMKILLVGTDVRSPIYKLETTHCSVIMMHLCVPGPLPVKCANPELIISGLTCGLFKQGSNTIFSVPNSRCFNNAHQSISQ